MTEPKLAKDMSPAEYKAKLAELRRSPPPLQPVDTTRSARDMTKEQREQFLKEHARRWR